MKAGTCATVMYSEQKPDLQDMLEGGVGLLPGQCVQQGQGCIAHACIWGFPGTGHHQAHLQGLQPGHCCPLCNVVHCLQGQCQGVALLR